MLQQPKTDTQMHRYRYRPALWHTLTHKHTHTQPQPNKGRWGSGSGWFGGWVSAFVSIPRLLGPLAVADCLALCANCNCFKSFPLPTHGISVPRSLRTRGACAQKKKKEKIKTKMEEGWGVERQDFTTCRAESWLICRHQQ